MRIRDLRDHGVPPEVLELIERRNIHELTPVQQAAIDKGVLRGESVVVSAPTSAGKTLIGELVAAKNAGSGSLTVFLVSHKALARQVYELMTTLYLDDSGSPYLKAGILTGDFDTVNGQWSRHDFVVSTYEKLHASISASPGALRSLRAVVADELQTLGDRFRGQVFELLMARLLSADRRPQIIGLSATAPNSADLARWLEAEHVQIAERHPPLEQEIWLPRKRIVYRAGSDEPEEISLDLEPHAIPEAVRWLLDQELGPIVVMATMKQQAADCAQAIAATRPVDQEFDEDLIDNFRAHSDSDEVTQNCIHCLRRGVGIHHADLTPEQRLIVERAFLERQLPVLVATTTLVAGVNLPIRTVLYPSLTRWTGRETYIERGEYLNGAGRAGRLGIHDKGTVVLWTESVADARAAAKRFVLGESEPVESQLESRTEEFRFLHLLSILGKGTPATIAQLASKTLWGFERKLSEKNDLLLKQADKFSACASDVAIASCLISDGNEMRPSAIGRAIVRSGLEPRDVLQAVAEARRFHQSTPPKTTDRRAARMLCRMCAASFMDGYLPYAGVMRRRWASKLEPTIGTLVDRQAGLFTNPMQLVAAGHALLATREADVPDVPAAAMRNQLAERVRLCDRLAFLIRAACSVLDAEDAPAYEATTQRLTLLADQLEYRLSARAVPLARAFARHPARYVGPVRIEKLAGVVEGDAARVLTLDDDQLSSAVGPAQVIGVRQSLIAYFEGLAKERSARQIEEASQDDDLLKLVERLHRLSGRGFETPVKDALNALGWKVKAVKERDDGEHPDVVGEDNLGTDVIAECKTTRQLAGDVSQKEAMEVAKKAPNGFRGLVMTVGRPTFADRAIEEAMKKKSAWPNVHLVTGGALAELLIATTLRGMTKEFASSILRDFTHVDVWRVRDEEERDREEEAADTR